MKTKPDPPASESLGFLGSRPTGYPDIRIGQRVTLPSYLGGGEGHVTRVRFNYPFPFSGTDSPFIVDNYPLVQVCLPFATGDRTILVRAADLQPFTCPSCGRAMES